MSLSQELHSILDLYEPKMVYLTAALVLCCTVVAISGHGYMQDPPGRSSAWMFGFNTPKNFNHMGLFCGGAQVQHGSNGGKCGVCGDNFASNRPNEPGPGNKYATGTIVKQYQSGSTIDVTIHLTAYHKGYYEFKLCNNNVPQKGKDASARVTQDCFDKHLLTTADGSSTKFTAVNKESTMKVKLPNGVQCSACVLQWRYRAGNNWGCEGGKCGSGLGDQEEFWGCSDVSIGGGNADAVKPSDSVSQDDRTQPITIHPTQPTRPRPATDATPEPPKAGKLVCTSRAPYQNLDSWCTMMCNHAPGSCSLTHCSCQNA